MRHQAYTSSGTQWAELLELCSVLLSRNASCLCSDSMGSSKGRPLESKACGFQPSRKTGEYRGADGLRLELGQSVRGPRQGNVTQSGWVEGDLQNVNAHRPGQGPVGPQRRPQCLFPVVQMFLEKGNGAGRHGRTVHGCGHGWSSGGFQHLREHSGSQCQQNRGKRVGDANRFGPQNEPTRSRGTKTGCTNSGASGCVMYGLSRA